MGQPTHFLTRRRFGMFIVTVPKEFAKTQKITLDADRQRRDDEHPVPHAHRLQHHAAEVVGREPEPRVQQPPVLRFAESGPTFAGPLATVGGALERTATVGTPMPLDRLGRRRRAVQQRRQRRR